MSETMKTFQGARDLLAEGSSIAKEDFLSGLLLIFKAIADELAEVLPIEAPSDDFDAVCAAARAFELRWNARKAAEDTERSRRGEPPLPVTMGDEAAVSLMVALYGQESLRADRDIERRLHEALNYLHMLLTHAANGLIDETPELAEWFIEGLARLAVHRSTNPEDDIESVAQMATMWVEDIVLEIHENRARILADELVDEDY